MHSANNRTDWTQAAEVRVGGSPKSTLNYGADSVWELAESPTFDDDRCVLAL